MRVIFVTEFLPGNKRKSVFGAFQRMNLFIEAIKSVSEIKLVFLVSRNEVRRKTNKNILRKKVMKIYGDKVDPVFISTPKSINEFTISQKIKFFLKSFIKSAFGTRKDSIYYHNNSLRNTGLKKIISNYKPDFIFVFKINSMLPFLLNPETSQQIYFDFCDIEHIRFIRTAHQKDQTIAQKMQSVFYKYLICNSERKTIRISDKVFVCSNKDKKHLDKFSQGDKIITIPNSVTLKRILPVPVKKTILYLGTYLYEPNVYAAELLIEHVFPRIRLIIPDCELIIAGDSPERIKFYSTSLEGVSYTGFVDDLDELYQNVRIVCTPISIGSGTRIKILEAASYGKPVVSTSIGVEGLEFEDGKEIFIRDHPDQIAEKCIELIMNKNLCARMGALSYKKVEALYNRKMILNQVCKILKDITD